MPRLNNALSGKRFARAIKPLIQEDASLSAYRRDFYGLSFYLQHQIQFVRQGSKVQPGLLLLYEEDLQEIIDYHSALYVVPLARSEEDVEKAGKRVILLRLEPKSNP